MGSCDRRATLGLAEGHMAEAHRLLQALQGEVAEYTAGTVHP